MVYKSQHFGKSRLVIFPFIERLSSLRRLKCTSIIEKGPQSVSFIEKVFFLYSKCPLSEVLLYKNIFSAVLHASRSHVRCGQVQLCIIPVAHKLMFMASSVPRTSYKLCFFDKSKFICPTFNVR